MFKDRTLVDIELGEQNKLHILLRPKADHCGDVQALCIWSGSQLEPNPYPDRMKFEIDDLPVLHTV